MRVRLFSAGIRNVAFRAANRCTVILGDARGPLDNQRPTKLDSRDKERVSTFDKALDESIERSDRSPIV